MIVMDAAQVWGHRLGPSCHLISTLAGDEGRAELLAFARRIGLREAWLQNAGQASEHFDLFGSRIERARVAGAKELGRADFVNVIRAKRGDKPIGAFNQ